jgi:2-polyprenyl-3-methyl-5-hydroxy-6-metoxy-1,4-benzoquinol methylase
MKVFEKIYDHRQANSWSSNLRNHRLNLFKSLLAALKTPVKILDVGGTLDFWKKSELINSTQTIQLTVLNMSPMEVDPKYQNVKTVVGDARNMPEFADDEFDVVFSNSVIEHVGDYRDQQMMSQEILRVGKRYFIQTPNLYFPIEPHFVFPFFQFFPRKLKFWLVTHFKLGWYDRVTDEKEAWAIVDEIRLLSRKEFMSIFPNGDLYQEKVFGLTKSFIAYGGWDNSIQ